jgi:hypothetical protein
MTTHTTTDIGHVTAIERMHLDLPATSDPASWTEQLRQEVLAYRANPDVTFPDPQGWMEDAAAHDLIIREDVAEEELAERRVRWSGGRRRGAPS